jgi:hypothetical protein
MLDRQVTLEQTIYVQNNLEKKIEESVNEDIIRLDNGYSLVKTSYLESRKLFMNTVVNCNKDYGNKKSKRITKCQHTEAKHYAKVV